jgi:hypothetical protein
MSSAAALGSATTHPEQRIEVLFAELAQLAGQRNAIDGAPWRSSPSWIVTSCGGHGCAFGGGVGDLDAEVSAANAHTIATVAPRRGEFPRCAQDMTKDRLPLDQVGVIAARAGADSDEHYAQLARVATVNQLRTAVKLEPRPDPDPAPPPQPSSVSS